MEPNNPAKGATPNLDKYTSLSIDIVGPVRYSTVLVPAGSGAAGTAVVGFAERQSGNCRGGNPKTASNPAVCGPPLGRQLLRPRDLWSLPTGPDLAEEVAVSGVSLKCVRKQLAISKWQLAFVY
jgi:hypothetical protein